MEQEADIFQDGPYNRHTRTQARTQTYSFDNI